jgi:hypothetical protein
MSDAHRTLRLHARAAQAGSASCALVFAPFAHVTAPANLIQSEY